MEKETVYDFVIVGAGVFGLGAAIELKQRNNNARVLVLDPGPVPHKNAASTDISKVIRMDYGDDELYTSMMEDCFPIWRRWNEEWNEQVYFETGLVGIVDSIDADTFEGKTIETLMKRKHPIDKLDQSTFKKRFPLWKQDRVGYFNPTAGWARSGLVVEHLNRIAVSIGVNVQYGSLDKLLLKPDPSVPGNQICYGILTQDSQKILAPIVVVAAGASTSLLLPQVRSIMWPTAQPVFHFEVKDPSLFPVEQFPVFFSSISKTGFYGFPMIEEEKSVKMAPRKQNHLKDDSTPAFRIKVGQHGPGWKLSEISTKSLDELWAKVGPIEEKKIRNWLSAALPVLADAKIVYTRLCVYCDMFDGDFLIDHCPTVSGLVVASGGSGHGFKFAPILGSIIYDVIHKLPNKYKHRFVWREFKEGKKEASRHLSTDANPQSLASL